MPQIFDALADAISTRILDIAGRRIGQERVQTWKNVLNKSGRGSTFVRAAIIADDVHAQAAPVPTVAPTPDRNRFYTKSSQRSKRRRRSKNITLR